MNLSQRLILKYYKTKLQTIGAVSPRKAAEAAFRLFCTPYNGKQKHKEPPVFNKAKKIELVTEGLTLRGFNWKPHNPTGEKILICHGFDSSSYRFDKYVEQLLLKGKQVTAFDAPGHGLSDGKLINTLLYRNVILEINTQFGPFHGIMAHSLGGLAASLAAEQLQYPSLKLVLLAPATEASRAVTNFFKLIPVQEKTRIYFDALIEELGGRPIEWYSITRAIQTIHSPVLWVHDKKDTICPYEDTLAVQQLQLPNVQFIFTEGLGHSKVYREQHIQKAVIDFFTA